MIGKVSIYINLSISALILLLGVFALFESKPTNKEDLITFVCIEFVFGIFLALDIICVILLRNNYYKKINENNFYKKGNVIFILSVLATIGSWFILISLFVSIYDIKHKSSKSIILFQVFSLLIFAIHAITCIICLIQYQRLKKINKNLQADIISTIGNNIV